MVNFQAYDTEKYATRYGVEAARRSVAINRSPLPGWEEALIRLVIPPDTEVLRLQLTLPSDRADYTSYDATLNDASGGRILSQKGLRPETTRSGKALILRVSPRLLQPKHYFVMVNGQTADGRTEFVEEYHFTVVEKK